MLTEHIKGGEIKKGEGNILKEAEKKKLWKRLAQQDELAPFIVGKHQEWREKNRKKGKR